MEKEFVTIEQAKELFELGYDLPAVKRYFHMTGKFADDFDAPLKQQVFRWFRQKYEVYPTIMTETEDDSLYFRFIAEGGPEWLSFSKIYYTYEEAEDACIDKLIELSKQLNNK